jgi:hypothetical protein
MGKITALIGIWLVGYALGFIAYLALPAIGAFIVAMLPFLAINGQIVGAALAGLGSSFIVLLLTLVWARVTKPRYP